MCIFFIENILWRYNYHTYLLFISLLGVVFPLTKLSLLCPLVKDVLFSWFSFILDSNSVSLFLSHSTVKLSTVNWLGKSFPADSSTKLSSKTNFTGSVGVVLKITKMLVLPHERGQMIFLIDFFKNENLFQKVFLI